MFTTALECKRQGRGWRVLHVHTESGVKTGQFMAEKLDCFSQPLNRSFSKYLKRNGYENLGEYVIPSVYMYNLTAPGMFVQLFYELPTTDAEEYKEKILRMQDICGEYLHLKLLSDLTSKEYQNYKRLHIDV